MDISDVDDWYAFHRDDLLKGGFGTYSSGQYLKRNHVLVEMIEGFEFKTVVEVAGAEGNLADMLLKKYSFIERYDWSDMVSEAVIYADEIIGDERFNAVILDLDVEKPVKADLFVCTALEHTLKYREVIEELDKDTLVLLSLPSFPSYAHRVNFPKFTDVINIYGDLLDFIKVEVFFCSSYGLREMFFILIKKCLERVDLLKGFRKMGLFRRGCYGDPKNYKWLLVGVRK